jgi:hypothetical protein
MNLRQAKSLITFDLPVDTVHLNALFGNTHREHLSRFSSWSLKGTRKMIIARYWFNYVTIHFAILYGSAALFTLAFSGQFNQYYLPAFSIAGTLSFFVLFMFQYWPVFYSNLLPKLDSLMDEYESQQTASMRFQSLRELQERFAQEYQLIAEQREEIVKERQQMEIRHKELVKCRKEQFPTLTLSLIFYVLDKTSGMNFLQCNDKSAALLTRLYGKDQGGIKDNLQLILGKKQELSARHRTEILNRLNDASTFFHEAQFAEGVRMLQSLELKFKE